jgi:hypothetical protein
MIKHLATFYSVRITFNSFDLRYFKYLLTYRLYIGS